MYGISLFPKVEFSLQFLFLWLICNSAETLTLIACHLQKKTWQDILYSDYVNSLYLISLCRWVNIIRCSQESSYDDPGTVRFPM